MVLGRFADVIYRPEVLAQFKIQKDKRFDLAKFWKVVKNILIGQLFIIIPSGVLYAYASENGIGALPPF
jgi:hypothetical protein